jgi:hypothetical protein
MSKVIKISNGCSPSTHVSDELIPVNRVLITYGGGMGGANEKIYTTAIHKEQAINGMWRMIDITNGMERDVNPRFIVSVDKVNVVKVITDITEHTNYHEVVCIENILTRLIDIGVDTYEMVSEHISDSEMKIISKENLVLSN